MGKSNGIILITSINVQPEFAADLMSRRDNMWVEEKSHNVQRAIGTPCARHIPATNNDHIYYNSLRPSERIHPGAPLPLCPAVSWRDEMYSVAPAASLLSLREILLAPRICFR